ncbi:MAG: shikimate kinase [Oscillochloridaceae bacterium umkhey_bin13]
MNPSLQPRSLALIGLSGAGKTTVSQLLAERLGFTLYDTDELVVEAAGVSIPTIFATQGEAAFRAMEEGAVAFATFDRPAVIATGGGVVLSENNRTLLRRSSFVVWLDAPDAELLARLRADPVNRPLLAADPVTQLATLRTVRGPLYAATAHMTLIVSGLSPDAIVDQIIAAYQES